MGNEKKPGYRLSLAAGELVIGVAERVWRRLPERARAGLEARFFGAVFQVTRVTNDNYGYRPDEPGSGQGGARKESPGEED